LYFQGGKVTKNFSKPLGTGDESAADFVIEMLRGDDTYGINFDRVQWDKKRQRYVIVEFLLCDEKQFPRGITPYTSHPNRYFHKNAQKFISLWKLAQELDAILYLINYSKEGTEHEDKVLGMRVLDVDSSSSMPVKTKNRKFTRAEFSKWFRDLNARGRR
jgi:hypothetical protein